MEVRKSIPADLPRIMEIYAAARNFMRRSGNMTQWIDGYPSEDVICLDMRAGNSYVVCAGGRVVGTFAFIEGEDATYAYIEGEWLNDKRYGTIHRIASDGTVRGVADESLKFCCKKIGNIRIDTHRDNAAMLGWIGRSGFKKCGIIYVADGSPRCAFQLCVD